MKNKVLIKIVAIDLDTEYDFFIPVNEVVWKVKKMIVKILFSNNNGYNNFILMNKLNSRIYNNNEIIINTDIRNGTELILIGMEGIKNEL